MELGCMPLFKAAIALCGIYQLYAVAQGHIDLRIRASVLVFAMAITTVCIYGIQCNLTDPMHYKWIVLLLCSFGSLTRLLREKHYRNG